MNKNTILVVVLSLLVLVSGVVLLGVSSTVNMERVFVGGLTTAWQIGGNFSAGQTLSLEIKAGSDWGRSEAIAGGEDVIEMQFNSTLKVADGAEMNFSSWYSVYPSTTAQAPQMEPINTTVVSSTGDDSLEVQDTIHGVRCEVKRDVNLTVNLDRDSVTNNLGPNVNQPPKLRLVADAPAYPYYYLLPIALVAVSAGVGLLGYGFYLSRAQKRVRRIQRRKVVGSGNR